VLVYWLRDRMAAWLVALVGIVTAVMALGSTIRWNGRETGFPAPYRLLTEIPPFDTVVTTRWAMVTSCAIGVLLALAADRVLARARSIEPAGLPLRLLAAGAAVAVLLPVAPTPIGVQDRLPVPTFISSGHWHRYVADDRTLVAVPMTGTLGMRWAEAAHLRFAIPEGYFLGPTSATDLRGRFFAPPRPTQLILDDAENGSADPIGPAERAQARADVRFWRADAVVVDTAGPAPDNLRTALDQLFGPGQRVDDVWVWDVRALSR
jgi:hypothetical protein